MKSTTLLLVLVVACGGPAIADNAPIEPAGTVAPAISESTTTTSATTSTTVESIAETAEVDGPEPAQTIEELGATGPDAELIEFEAVWLCEAQRQTFDSPGAADETLNARLGETGIARSQYDTFKAGLTEDAVARKQILDLFIAGCS